MIFVSRQYMKMSRYVLFGPGFSLRAFSPLKVVLGDTGSASRTEKLATVSASAEQRRHVRWRMEPWIPLDPVEGSNSAIYPRSLPLRIQVLHVEDEDVICVVAATWTRLAASGQLIISSLSNQILQESAGEVGDEPHSVAFIHSGGRINGKRSVCMTDGPADSGQSTLKVNSETTGWTKRSEQGNPGCNKK